MLHRFVITAFLLALAGLASADIFRPAYLELRETGDGHCDVLWKVPALGSDRRLSAYVQFPEDTVLLDESRIVIVNGAWVERFEIRHEGGLAGQTISIQGGAVGVTDVIARVERVDGSSQVERLPAERPVFTVRATASAGEVAWSYLVLGVEHILGGIDHLLFVLTLLLIVRVSFGLLHGFGFAGALAEVGLPQATCPGEIRSGSARLLRRNALLKDYRLQWG